jgi:hypothetical protein
MFKTGLLPFDHSTSIKFNHHQQTFPADHIDILRVDAGREKTNPFFFHVVSLEMLVARV